MKDLSIIIVNWNTRGLLKSCLGSIKRYCQAVSFEIIVIDNASADGSAEMVEKDFPDATLIKSNENIGFAAANNIGIKKAQGRHTLLLNSDTELISDAPSRMVSYLDNHKDIGVLGCRLLNRDRSLQPSVRRFPDFISQALILLKLHRLFPQLRVMRRYRAEKFDYSRTQAVDQVMGACFMIPGGVIDRVGLLDERYWIWFEEVDYCRMAKDKGFRIVFLSDAEVVHHGGSSFAQQLSLAKQRRYNESLLRYFWKHGRASAYVALAVLNPISLLLASLLTLGQLLRNSKT